jgi:hypothetical protein
MPTDAIDQAIATFGRLIQNANAQRQCPAPMPSAKSQPLPLSEFINISLSNSPALIPHTTFIDLLKMEGE